MRTDEWALKVLIREGKTAHLSMRCAVSSLPLGRAELVQEVTVLPHELGDFRCQYRFCRKCARLLLAGGKI